MHGEIVFIYAYNYVFLSYLVVLQTNKISLVLLFLKKFKQSFHLKSINKLKF